MKVKTVYDLLTGLIEANPEVLELDMAYGNINQKYETHLSQYSDNTIDNPDIVEWGPILIKDGNSLANPKTYFYADGNICNEPKIASKHGVQLYIKQMRDGGASVLEETEYKSIKNYIIIR